LEKYDKVVISFAFLMIVVPFVSYTSAHIIAVGYKIKPFVTSSLIDSTGFQYPASVEEKATEILLKPASILTSVYFGTIPTFAYIIYQKWSIKLKEKETQSHKIYLNIYVLLVLGIFLSQIYWMSMSVVYPISYTRSLTQEEIEGGLISITGESTIPYFAPLIVTPFIWIVVLCIYTRILFYFLSKQEISELFSYERLFVDSFI